MSEEESRAEKQGRVAIKFINSVTGEELTPEEVEDSVEASITEVQHQFVKLIEFMVRMKDGTLTETDDFLDFSPVLAQGYNRTGPVVVIVEEI